MKNPMIDRLATFGVREFNFVNISRKGRSSSEVYFDAYNIDLSCSQSGNGSIILVMVILYN